MNVRELIEELEKITDDLAPVFDLDGDEVRAIRYNTAIGVVELR